MKIKKWKNGLYFKLSKNKGIEIELNKNSQYSPLNFGISFNITHRTDHAGISLNLYLIWIELTIQLYDKRHWDYENNYWETYE